MPRLYNQKPMLTLILLTLLLGITLGILLLTLFLL